MVDTAQGYEDLYRQLTDQPKARKRKLGKLRKLPERARQWREQPPGEANAAIPPTEDFGELASYPIPKKANEPTAILAAWMAQEALSIRNSYRHPVDLAAWRSTICCRSVSRSCSLGHGRTLTSAEAVVL